MDDEKSGKKKAMFRASAAYAHNFHSVPRLMDRILFSMKGIPGSLKRIRSLPRNVVLALARSGILSSKAVCRIYRLFGVKIGEMSSIAPQGVYLDVIGLRHISIGKDVHISPNVSIITHTQTPPFLAPTYGRGGIEKPDRWKPGPVKIGDGVVIYTGATILPGVTVGEGAIIAAGAVVNGDVEPFSIMGGVPAKPIGSTRTGTPEKIQDGIETTHFKYGIPGALCISADFELNWATRDRYRKTGFMTRRFFPGLLAFLEKYNAPVTWATVGHLFLEECHRGPGPGRPHADVLTAIDGWFDVDPCTNVGEAPSWYAPDLVRMIMDSPVEHDIGCHTFSHADLSDERCDSIYAPKQCSHDVALGELEKCKEVMEPFGLIPRSFVFPKNYEGNYEALREAGITCFRGRNISGLLSYLEKVHGLWDIPASESFSLLLLLRSADDIDYRLRRYLEDSAATGKCVHFWFHPWFMSPKVLRLLEPVFDRIVKMRNSGELWIATMPEIAAYCEARENTKIEVERKDKGLVISLRCDLDEGRYGIPDITLRIPGVMLRPELSIEDYGISSDPTSIEPVVALREGDLYITVPVNTRTITLTPPG